jgi:hypothetical protein
LGVGVGLLSSTEHPFLRLITHCVFHHKCVYEPAKSNEYSID